MIAFAYCYGSALYLSNGGVKEGNRFDSSGGCRKGEKWMITWICTHCIEIQSLNIFTSLHGWCFRWYFSCHDPKNIGIFVLVSETPAILGRRYWYCCGWRHRLLLFPLYLSATQTHSKHRRCTGWEGGAVCSSVPSLSSPFSETASVHGYDSKQPSIVPIFPASYTLINALVQRLHAYVPQFFATSLCRLTVDAGCLFSPGLNTWLLCVYAR